MLLSAQSQNYYGVYETIVNNKLNDFKKKKILTDSLINEIENTNNINSIADIACDFSLKAYLNNSSEDAIHYSKIAIKNRESLKIIDDTYVKSLHRLASYYYNYNKCKEAILYFEKVIKLNLSPLRTALSYCTIGSCHYQSNDYYKAIQYYKTGIKKLEESDLTLYLPNEYVNLASIYNELYTKESLKSQLILLKKIEALQQNSNTNIEDKIRLNTSFSTLYSSEYFFNAELAIHYSNLNLKLLSKTNDSVYKCISYNNLADIYNSKDSDSALYYANKAIANCNRIESISKAHLHKSRFYKNKKDYNSSLISIQEGINVLTKQKQNPLDSISLKPLKESDDKDHLLYMLVEKNKLIALKIKEKNRSDYSELLLQHLLVEDSLIDNIQTNTTNTSKLHWRLKASEVYTQGAKVCYDLNKPKIAFHFSEKSKALLLTESIINNNSLSNLPENLKSKEIELRKTSINSNNKLEAQLNYEKFIDSIKLAYPQYFKNKSLEKIVSLKGFQEEMSEKKLVISYFWPSSNLENNTVFALFISKKEVTLLPLGNSKKINKLIDKYYSLISKPFNTQSDKKEFNIISNKLYKTLFPSNKVETLINGKELVIIPDGKLQNIPFEALTKKESDLEYLIKHNAISYAYSLSFLEHNKSINRTTTKEFTGFAPVNFGMLNLETLANSASEIKNANNIIHGDIFTFNKATKKSFLNNTRGSKIIHLATHASVAENKPWIAFSDEKMTLEELYAFKNNSELTILSSCNTSRGKISEGEGVMSLARGFFYSGSNSVIASLWNVNDKSSALIMKDFYKKLSKDKSKSQSLRSAKLNYLNSNSLTNASPYYWSSFILLGNAKSIYPNNDFSKFYHLILILITVTTILLFFLYKKKK